MPELPEVETIIRKLSEGTEGGSPLAGKIIRSADLQWEGCLVEPSPAEFRERIVNQQIISIGRRAKYIHFNLSRDTLIIHLRMSGDLRVENRLEPNILSLPHDRATLNFTDDFRLIFNDTRKFGRIWLTREPEAILGKLGPEPLDPEFTPLEFHHRLAGRHRQLKPLLMDQSFLSGLGNIYTDESLFEARLNPLQSSNELTYEKCEKLLIAIRVVLAEGIRRNGSSIDWAYKGGSFQNSFRVYQRTGKPCLTCGTIITKIVVGQRSTHFCPVCQPRYPSIMQEKY